MFEISFDASEFEAKARQLAVAAELEVPFAIALAMNRAVQNARESLMDETWGNAGIAHRNAGFIRAALHVGEWATKGNLRVEIFDQLADHTLLYKLALGGIHTPKTKTSLAIPTRAVTRTSRGVASAQRPMNLKGSFVADLRGRGKAIWVRQKGTKGIKLMYVLKPAVPVPALVPFFTDFNETFSEDLRSNFAGSMMRAVLSSRR